MPIEGEIKINVAGKSGQVESVSITSSRPLHITQFFKGKSIDTVADLINTLYHLCNTAHRFSFLRLLDSSGVIKLSKNEISAYQLLLDMETIREHSFSIATKWGQGSDRSVDTNIVNLLTILKEISTTLFSGADPLSLVDKELQAFNSIDELIIKLENQLGLLLIDAHPESMHPFLDYDSFNHWLQNSNSQSAVFLNYLKEHQFDDLGNVEAFHLPDFDPQGISVLLQNADFIKQPMYQNTIFETTPYSRQSEHQLIKQLFSIYGNGLFTRAVAQLLEVFELLNNIKHNYTDIKFEKISYEIQRFGGESNALVQLEAARGRLFHQISVQDDKIDSYQILAPTEWNFHPQGVLNRMIETLTYKNEEDLIDKIKLLVNTVDPCVGYSIEIDRI